MSSSWELVLWRKKSFTGNRAWYLAKNQNTIGQPHSKNEDNPTLNQRKDQPLLNSPSLLTNSVTDDPVELQRDANIKRESKELADSARLFDAATTITRCTSKPSRQESKQIATSDTRKRQRDRYANYGHRLQEDHLYSLTISSNGIECHGSHCQPSVFNASHRCRPIIVDQRIDSIEMMPLMDEQDIKQNISYMSLTNLSNLIDHEPNVSRRDSYSRSTSSILMHKPSLFLADLFNKMTHEQRAKSIAQLYENLTQSNPDKLQHTASLPNLESKPMKLYSVASIFSENTSANGSQVNIVASPSKKKLIADDLDRETASSTFPKQQMSHDKASDKVPSSITHLPMVKPSPVRIQSSRSDATIDSDKTKGNRSNNSLEVYPDEQSSKVKSESSRSANIERTNPHLSNTLNRIDSKTKNSTTSKSTVSEQYDWDREINQQSKAILSPLTTTDKEESSRSFHFQEDMTLSNTNLDKSVKIPSKESDKTQLLPTIDERSQSTHSPHLIPGEEGDLSVITRATTASTNLTITTDENDDQSKLINEQLKRSSLGLARDSLELLRHTPAHQASKDEQIISSSDNKITSHPRKSVLKSHLDSSENLPTPELISYVAIDEVQGDKHLLEKHMQRRSLTLGNGGTVISCLSPRPRRDSLTLLQERYSGSVTPHSGYYRLSGSENKRVEFIRELGNTITPMLHLGRETRLKNSSNKPSCFTDHHPIDSVERRKSDTSIMDTQQPFEIEPSKTTSFIQTNDIKSERISFDKNDYDEIIRLLITPLMSKQKKSSVDIRCPSNIEVHVHHRLTTLQNVIFMILLISFYLFIFIKSHYWDEYY